jgi:CRP-like cAMP-binding protein
MPLVVADHIPPADVSVRTPRTRTGSDEARGRSSGPASFALEGDDRAEGLPASQAYPPGVELFQQETPAEDVFFVRRGLVKLLFLQPDGHEIIVGLRSQGWFLGSAPVLLGKPYAATAVTVTNCRLSRIRASEFRHLIRANGRLSWQLHEMHSLELSRYLSLVTDLGCLTARQRLGRLFAELAPLLSQGTSGQGTRIRMPLRQWEIAQLIAVTPQYLCQLLQDMEREGVLKREKGAFVLHRHSAI